ncbi:MAG: hypothetical protein PHS62_00375 [Patescibacteria group bacterium]|nr:hypothetical protein [Patescibacteria group bacterium]
MEIKEAKKIFKENFIGPDELDKIADKLNFAPAISYGKIPKINFNDEQLKKAAKDYILILGIPKAANGDNLTLNLMRDFLGTDPDEKEPCFYHQDWYLKEKFAAETSLKFNWHLIKKEVEKKTRGQNPETMIGAAFPSAILTAFTFFAYYYTAGQILWRHDFIWCADKDHNGDRIYTGRYVDPYGINKKGFNIHRHLSIRPCYGLIPEIK